MITQNSVVLCERCAIFAKRPLLKIDLLKLKPKDLIFYLQSKHISTTGCVEKEELVGLVLTHVNQNDTPNIGSPNGNKFPDFGGDTDKPFENIKQTCQNFFNNITDKIASDFSFDTKTTQAASNSGGGMAGAGGSSPHISEQPRISTREIPSYSSFQNQPTDQSSPPPPSTQQQQPANSTRSTPTSPISSPGVSISSISSHSTVSRSPQPASASCGAPTDGQSSSEPIRGKPAPASSSAGARNRLLDNVLQDEGVISECDCSDDELINTFKDRSNREVGGANSTSPPTISPVDNLAAGPSGSGSSNGLAQKTSPSLQVGTYEDSSESSFEELGAIGGISDDNKTESVAQNEPWQFVNKLENDAITIEDKKTLPATTHREEEPSAGTSTDVALVSSESSSAPSRAARIFASRPKRVVRRRSDGYLSRRRHGDEHSYNWNSKELSVEEEEGDNDDDDEEDEDEEAAAVSMRRRRSKCCGKCGKNKTNIKHHVMKLRQHLESANMSEAEIKQELEEFLVYLENRTRAELVDVGSATSPFFDGNDGIHVYGHVGADGGYDPGIAASRFPNLNNFDSLEELENLTVKQLKQILTLNRVDYKGCCEKQELFERVSRLWKNLKSCPAIEKLPTDELCKICMDAPIECVILECGHMATCTNCGKVLSECPICRQYIVRVVRFFRA
ncbi:probable serine/threonine-protein kinase dyrk2 isoform X2 [Eupeodes corollae]|nr:probable serine/threonine-protein kinase dyrk2 isoform X2 [Eupeodes corollae]